MARAAHRFAEAFRIAWERIPNAAKATIGQYLQSRPGEIYLCYRMNLGNPVQEPWGRCQWFDSRTLLTFLAPAIQGVEPLTLIADVAAHELAHCFTRGEGTWTAINEQEETNVRAITRAWGFGEPSTDAEAVAAFDRWRNRYQEFAEYTEERISGDWIRRLGAINQP